MQHAEQQAAPANQKKQVLHSDSPAAVQTLDARMEEFSRRKRSQPLQYIGAGYLHGFI